MSALAILMLVLVLTLVVGFATLDLFGAVLLSAAVPWLFVLNLMPVVLWMERKGSAWIQDRTGPERAYIPGVGIRLAGFVHNLADMLKLATKEELVPRHVNRGLYILAPVLSVTIALLIGAVIPFAAPVTFESGFVFRLQALDLNIGILWVLAVSAMGVYSVVLAGWASNNKYSQLAGLRASASMISYEVVFGLALAGVFLVFGSVRLDEIVQAQSGAWLGIIPRWGVFTQPLGFLLFFVAALAETNRAPFDVSEAESELVAGFHTEYGGFKFALFFMAEYISIIVQCLLLATLFFGGWQLLPWMDTRAFLSQPGNTALVLKILLGVVFVGGTLVGSRLFRWHQTNKLRWKDARAREGLILSVLLGFGPALVSLAILLLWGWSGGLSFNRNALGAAAVELLALSVKTLIFAWIFVWIRWTVPRFRYDQIMGLGWKVLLPLGMANLMLTALLVQLGIL